MNKKSFLVIAVFFLFCSVELLHADWLEIDKLVASDGAGFDRFGNSVSVSGDYAIVGAYNDDDKGSNSGSAYIFRRDGEDWYEQAKLLASDGAAEDFFGGSVSVSGDYAIVGAVGDDDKGSLSGSAYIFAPNEVDPNNWDQIAKLTASDGAADDRFGGSVSFSGDYAIVGAYWDDDNGDDSGSAYIFKRDGTDWSQQDKLLASDGAGGDRFGGSVSFSGDYAIVGAYNDDDSGSNSGSAYIFAPNEFEPNSWYQVAKLTASDGAGGDYFGRSVSVSGDYAVVGAYGDDDNGSSSGSAYIFKRDGTDWNEQDKLLASDGTGGEWFGLSVSISGDYAVVGAYWDGDNGDYSGSAYIFGRDVTAWSQQDKLLASDGAAYAYFGRSVSIDGNYAIVGADGSGGSGSAYMFFAACPKSDLTGDCSVDFEDFSVLGNAWFSEVGDLNWDAACDISEPNDNIINGLDLAVFVNNWLEGVPEDLNSMVWVYIDDSGIPEHEGFTGYMSKYETTNAQYCQFLNAALSSGDITVDADIVYGANGSNSGADFVDEAYYVLAGSGYTNDGATNGGATRINWTGSSFTVDSGFENHPVTYVSWYGSMAFASYYGWRLPTEWEWQAVADHTIADPYAYGCGPSINNSIANYLGSTHPDGTTVVGNFGTYGYGMCDMAGNVFEWTSSCYYEDCDPDDRVVRGGGWLSIDYYCSVSSRTNTGPGSVYGTTGFRVCR